MKKEIEFCKLYCGELTPEQLTMVEYHTKKTNFTVSDARLAAWYSCH